MFTTLKPTLRILAFYAAIMLAGLGVQQMWAVLSPVTHAAARSADDHTVTAQKLLSAKSTLNAAALVGSSYMGQCRETAIYVDWGTGVASGAVQIETAVDDNYTGTWAPLQLVTFAAAAPKQDVVQITGVHWAIRTRISTVLAGGTVNTWIVCN